MIKFEVVAVVIGVLVSTNLAAQAAVNVRILSAGKTTKTLQLPKDVVIRVSAREIQRLQTPQGKIRKVTLIGKATVSVLKNNHSLMHISAEEAVVEMETSGAATPDTSSIEFVSASVLLPVWGSPNAATTTIQKFLDERSTGNTAGAWALLTARLQASLPPAPSRDEQVNLLNDPKYVAQLTPQTRALMAMSMDFANKLDYKFRVLGPAKDNPNLVVIQAYPTSAPEEIATVQAIVVPDLTPEGTLHIDNFSTGWSNGATSTPKH